MKVRIKEKFNSIVSNKTVLVCALLCVMYVLSGFLKWIEIGYGIVGIIAMWFLPIQSAFCIFMFSHSFTWSNIGLTCGYTIIFIGFFVILLTKYIIGVKKGKYELHKKLISLIGLFSLIFTLTGIGIDIYLGPVRFLLYLPLFYLIFAMRKEFNIAQGMNYMLGGFISSAALALISMNMPGFQYPVYLEGRFYGFFNNPNPVYIRGMFLITYYMYRLLKDKLSLINFAIIFVLCAGINLLTLSKTAMAMMVLFTLIFIILWLKKDFKKNIKWVLFFIMGLSIICLILNDYVLKIVERFAQAFKSSNFISSLITNRDYVWEQYMSAVCSTPYRLLFGHGFLAENVIVFEPNSPYNTPHSLYLFCLYRFGLLGTIMLGYIIYLFIKSINKTKPKLIAYLPLGFFLLESLIENTFQPYNLPSLMFAIMILFMDCEPKGEKQIKSAT